jgi:hypothetical protein
MGQPEWIAEAWMLIAACAEGQAAEGLVERCRSCCAAHLEQHRLASIGALIAAADLSLSQNDPDNARKYAAQASHLLFRKSVSIPRYQACLDLILARVSASTGGRFGSADVDSAIDRVMKFAHHNGNDKLPASPLLFQWNRLNAIGWSPAGRKNDVDPREKWFQNVHESMQKGSVWRLDHVNAMHWIGFAHGRSGVQVAEQRFEKKVERTGDVESHQFLLNIDTLFRSRYWSQRTQCGRTEQMLSCAKQRQFPQPTHGLDEAVERANEVWSQPIDIEGQEAQVSSEVIASAMTTLTLSRQPMIDSVLPKLQSEDISLLQEDEVLIALVGVGKFIHGTFTYQGQTRSWQVPLQKVHHGVAELLAKLGIVDEHRPVDFEAKWQPIAFELRNLIFPESTLEGLQGARKLVIVPDGVLWYLPFEVLPISESGGKIWHDRFEISYAGTPGLALRRNHKPNDTDDVTTGSRLTIDEPIDASDWRTERWLQLNRRPGPLILSQYQTQSQSPTLGDGHDLSSLVIEMQIAKVPMMIIGRWPVEREAAELLMREFTQEMPHEGPMTAWRRGLQVLHRSPIDVSKSPESTQEIRGDHPAFWAAYLLVQSPR